MARGPETTFIASVHRHLPETLYRMKNHNEFISGPADVWYSGKKADIWVEYKFIKKLPKVINLLDRKKKYCLSALQEEWLRERSKEGRAVYVVLGFTDGGVIFENRQWEKTWQDYQLSVYDRRGLAIWICANTKGHYEAPVRARKRLERCI